MKDSNLSLKFSGNCSLADENEFWGRGDVIHYKEDKAIRAFKINYSEEVNSFVFGCKFHFLFSQVIKGLSDQLSKTKIPEPLEGAMFEYGFNGNHFKKVLSYWKGEYLTKWSERQEYLNQFPQFTTNIQG
jgi:juvenile hormone epoxide hydrolase